MTIITRRARSLKRWLALALCLTLASLYYNVHKGAGVARTNMRTELRSHSYCPVSSLPPTPPDDLTYWAGERKVAGTVRLLVFSSGPPSSAKEILDLLASVRIKYKVTNKGRNMPDLFKLSKGELGKYLVVIFQDIRDYYLMDRLNRELLDKYCSRFKVGILGFLPPGSQQMDSHILPDISANSTVPFSVTSHQPLSSPRTLSSSLLRLLRPNLTLPVTMSGDWTHFTHLGQGVQPVLTARVGGIGQEVAVVVEDQGDREDRGERVRKVVIGAGASAQQQWFTKLVLLDAVDSLSKGLLSLPLSRYLLADIDDIFVGTSRLLPSDVSALVSGQERLAELVPGFRYNMGFSGKYFLSGGEEEDEGDRELVMNREKFWWFPHMWKHYQPHRFSNVSDLVYRMILNKDFADEQDIPVENRYSVAPHHSGVFPVHQQLYDAWREVWDVSVTSTEEYPNLRPARRRRGFQHSGISVLPRQTCGLFTKNTHYSDYPGGAQRLEDSIRGGELFMSIVTNPVSIFMTHMPNYCCDRLAQYTFESVASFARCHTNLHLKTVGPAQLASTYFTIFSEEEQAVWGNPCDDSRHVEIWSEEKNCMKLPNFLVIGPQKTGTTALSSFLQLHPNILANRPSQETFEEVQFFNGKNYVKGLDWYMDFFPPGNSSVYLFEKSANYFDGERVALRARRLLPQARIIAVVLPPGLRAYSWYQHMRAHDDHTALNFTFRQVITATHTTASKSLLSLQARCLDPGKYALHLDRWLAHYRPKQVYIVDGEEIKYNPANVLAKLQRFLEVEPFVDFSKMLVFDKVKRFFCMKVEGKKKCLGKGKGRVYPPMDDFSERWLRKFYFKSNSDLERLMARLGYSVPTWLTEQLIPSVNSDPDVLGSGKT